MSQLYKELKEEAVIGKLDRSSLVRSLSEVIWPNGFFAYLNDDDAPLKFQKAGNTSCWLLPLAQRDKPFYFLSQTLVGPPCGRSQDGPWLLPHVGSCMKEAFIHGGNSEASLKREVHWFNGSAD